MDAAVSPGLALERLTDKEREVLDLLLLHMTTKEIARELDLAPNTVDMRLRKARAKLGTSDRNSTARAYSMLLAACGKSTCDNLVISHEPAIPLSLREEAGDALLTFHDVGVYDRIPPWREEIEPKSPGGLGERFGPFARLALAVAIAVGTIVVVLVSLAVGQALSTLSLPAFFK